MFYLWKEDQPDIPRNPADILRGGGGPGRVSCPGGAPQGQEKLRCVASLRIKIVPHVNSKLYELQPPPAEYNNSADLRADW
ncbi:hypothetical protein PUN28_008584 [Cardiocondyla obscurior]|uniref:Uncharacterized protein n=1 Tax=Cardiocondyla obscurior TaxID=286306 RepID=A0AAW2G093_9HYME